MSLVIIKFTKSKSIPVFILFFLVKGNATAIEATTAICSADCQNDSISAILYDLRAGKLPDIVSLYNSVIFVYIVFRVDPASGLPNTINVCVFNDV